MESKVQVIRKPAVSPIEKVVITLDEREARLVKKLAGTTPGFGLRSLYELYDALDDALGDDNNDE